jgi:hypothetical protein
MATKNKRASAIPRYPERKWGPFHAGVSVCVWQNQVDTDSGPRYFRSITIAPRRFLDKKNGEWKDASSLRPTDLPSLILALEAAHAYCASTPLPGQAAEEEHVEDPAVLESGQVPF